MNIFKHLMRQPKADDLIGGKTMAQLLKECEIRTQREQMKKYPERFRNNGRMVLGVGCFE